MELRRVGEGGTRACSFAWPLTYHFPASLLSYGPLSRIIIARYVLVMYEWTCASGRCLPFEDPAHLADTAWALDCGALFTYEGMTLIALHMLQHMLTQFHLWCLLRNPDCIPCLRSAFECLPDASEFTASQLW